MGGLKGVRVDVVGGLKGVKEDFVCGLKGVRVDLVSKLRGKAWIQYFSKATLDQLKHLKSELMEKSKRNP